MNNINWLEQDAVIESITNLIESNLKSIKSFDEEMSKYKSKFNTKDIYEASTYDYWRGIKFATERSTNDLKELLEEITDVKLEELKELQEADENDRELRHSSYIGG